MAELFNILPKTLFDGKIRRGEYLFAPTGTKKSPTFRQGILKYAWLVTIALVLYTTV